LSDGTGIGDVVFDVVVLFLVAVLFFVLLVVLVF
jgi:hypothetical protein